MTDSTFSLVAQQAATLVGFGALVGVIVNVLKTFKIAKDGDAITIASIINFGVFCVLYILRVIKPEALAQVAALDAQAAQVATVATTVLYFIAQSSGSKLYQAIFRGLPIIGKSFSAEQLKDLASSFASSVSTTTQEQTKDSASTGQNSLGK